MSEKTKLTKSGTYLFPRLTFLLTRHPQDDMSSHSDHAAGDGVEPVVCRSKSESLQPKLDQMFSSLFSDLIRRANLPSHLAPDGIPVSNDHHTEDVEPLIHSKSPFFFNIHYIFLLLFVLELVRRLNLPPHGVIDSDSITESDTSSSGGGGSSLAKKSKPGKRYFSS